MYSLLALMTIGIFLGYLSTSYKHFISYANKIVMLCIYALLFLLGLQAGSNEMIVANIASLGGIALILTFGAVLGSLWFSKLTFLFFFKSHSKKEKDAKITVPSSQTKTEEKAWIGSLYILLTFVLGGALGMSGWIAKAAMQNDYALYALYGLLFFVGITIGGDRNAWKVIKETNIKIVLVPLGIILGSLLGTLIISFLLPSIQPQEAMAVGAGFGYYSLSSVLITQMSGEELGTIALLSNIIREVMTLIATPLFVRYFGKLAGIASGGATSMDTTLPIITAYSGKEWAMISIFSGIVLTIIVPLLVPFLLNL